jgi:glc operon protein GlcG
LPIIVDGITIGGIGVGSQTGEEDLEVAQAGLRAIAGVRSA